MSVTVTDEDDEFDLIAHPVCCQPFAEGADLLLAQDGGVYLVVEDDEGGECVLFAGEGIPALQRLRDTIDHMMSHIN